MLTMLTLSNVPLVALAIFLASQLASWVYSYITMPAEQKNARKLYTLPGSLPFIHDTLSLWRNRHRFHDWSVDNAKLANGVPTLSKILGGPPAIDLVTPQQLEDVQKTHFDCFVKGAIQQAGFYDLFGDGIIMAEGSNWVHQRKTAVSLFSARMLRDQMTQTVYRLLGVVKELLQDAQTKHEQVDLVQLFSRFTIQAFAEIGFGVDINFLETVEDHPVQRAFDRAQQISLQRFLLPQWLWRFQRWADLGTEREMKGHMKVINDMIYGVISKSLEERNSAGRKASSNGKRKMDIISLFLDNQKTLPDGTIEPFDPRLLRDISFSFLGAARDTTAAALSWFFYALSNHPEIERKLRNEMAEKLPDLMSGKIVAPAMDSLPELVYLDAVVKETLRLYPPVPSNFRQCKKSVVLSDGTFIPEGNLVMFKNYTLGRLEHIWGPDAEEFKPERWIDEATGKAKTVSAYQFNAFLAGPRLCIGMKMALAQIKMVATSVMSRFHLERESKEPISYEVAITLMMKDPLKVRVIPAASFA